MSPIRKRRIVFLLLSTVAALLLTTSGLLIMGRTRDFFSDRGQAREYWIAVEPVDWNIVPGGKDPMSGESFPADETTFKALIYRLYSPNWERPLADPGMPGPTLYGEVGDNIIIHFKNLDTYFKRPHSMHPHGVHYTPAYDGAYVQSNIQAGTAVPVGGSYLYHWLVKADSVGVWVYHDHSSEAMDNAARGMFGNLVLTRPGTPQPDKRFLVFFGELTPDVTGLPRSYFTINGRAYIATYKAKVGERVEWVVSSLGNSFHVFHIHGHRWIAPDTSNQDTFSLGPAQAYTMTFIEDNPGTWLVHCHVDFHMVAGMSAFYTVLD